MLKNVLYRGVCDMITLSRSAYCEKSSQFLFYSSFNRASACPERPIDKFHGGIKLEIFIGRLVRKKMKGL